MKRFIIAVAAVATSACSAITTGQYRGVSVGPLGCPEKEIEVSEHKTVVWAGQAITWRAECRGRVFLCSMAGATATCTEELSAAPPAPSTATKAATATSPATPPEAAPARAGCDVDTQCKGERICVDRACVDPPASAPAPAPEPQAAPPPG